MSIDEIISEIRSANEQLLFLSVALRAQSDPDNKAADEAQAIANRIALALSGQSK